MTDRKNITSTYTYDSVNRLTQVSAGGIVVSYTYDANSNRLTMTDSTGTTNYAYDSLDRLTSTRYPDVKSVQFVYDKAGNRTSLTYPGGTASLTYAYDAANRLSQITQGTLQWTFTYDSAGNRTRLTQPNGTQTVYTYLTNNWLSSVAHQNAGGSPFETISYTYDANGNRASQTDSSGPSTYTYDVLNRLIQAVYPGTYGTWSWTYDAVGNRTQQLAPAGTTIYTYDGNNRLTQAGGVVYTYDANGNLIGTSAGQSFTYDSFNRMTQAVGTGGTATYVYNGDGLKVQRIGPDGTTRYYHDGIRPIWETDTAGAITAQLDRDIFGNLLSRAEPGNRRYYHTDGLGSTVALTDEMGATAASMLYEAWGNVRVSTGTGHGKYRFTGAEMDTTSNLYHMGARFYDPSIGRWLSEDPVQSPFEPMSLNFYVYVANNPLVLTDPTGTRELEFEEGNGTFEAETASQVELTSRAGWEIYVDLVMAASKSHGVPAPLILAIIARESGFNPAAINPTSPDWGLMQVNTQTATDYGIPLSEANRLFNPETNISVGTRHLRELLRRFGGNEMLAISAYNLGASRVERIGPVNTGYINDVQAYERWFERTRCGGRC